MSHCLIVIQCYFCHKPYLVVRDNEWWPSHLFNLEIKCFSKTRTNASPKLEQMSKMNFHCLVNVFIDMFFFWYAVTVERYRMGTKWLVYKIKGLYLLSYFSLTLWSQTIMKVIIYLDFSSTLVFSEYHLKLSCFKITLLSIRNWRWQVFCEKEWDKLLRSVWISLWKKLMTCS